MKRVVLLCGKRVDPHPIFGRVTVPDIPGREKVGDLALHEDLGTDGFRVTLLSAPDDVQTSLVAHPVPSTVVSVEDAA